jgi:homoserine O-acetyltransferase
MDHHDVGRARGGVAKALARVQATSTVIAVDSDRLYPPRLQHELAGLLPDQPEVHVIHSLYGHDAFLVETEQAARGIGSALAPG